MANPIGEMSTISILEQIAKFAERRQQVLAGNIANIDTPGYRMRDLPIDKFEAALKEAIENRAVASSGSSEGVAADSTKPKIEDFFTDDLFRAEVATPKNLTFQDANNRSIEHQTMEMTKNAMMQAFAIELLSSQYRILETVISERL